MRILLTGGGTTEPIDQVRSITNRSTGRLAQLIAETIIAKTPWQVDYITTPQALQPAKNPRLTTYFIQSTAELLVTITELLENETYDAVIHSMAVSDYTGEAAFSQAAFSERLLVAQPELTMTGLEQFFSELGDQAVIDSKISSDAERLILTLKKTPKVIGEIKRRQPDTLLIGFKLLVGVPKEQLLNVAQSSLEKNHADYIFANDLTEITKDQHHGYLVAATGHTQEVFTKQEIAVLFIHVIQERINK